MTPVRGRGCRFGAKENGMPGQEHRVCKGIIIEREYRQEGGIGKLGEREKKRMTGERREETNESRGAVGLKTNTTTYEETSGIKDEGRCPCSAQIQEPPLSLVKD